MGPDAPARSTVEDLQGVGALFLRRQVSIGILRINFERAATRLRLLDPDAAEAVRAYIARLDEIQAGPEPERYVAVGAMLDRFDRWIREPVRPPPPVVPIVLQPVVVVPGPAVVVPEPPEFLALPSPGDAPPRPPDDPTDAPRRVL